MCIIHALMYPYSFSFLFLVDAKVTYLIDNYAYLEDPLRRGKCDGVQIEIPTTP